MTRALLALALLLACLPAFAIWGALAVSAMEARFEGWRAAARAGEE